MAPTCTSTPCTATASTRPRRSSPRRASTTCATIALTDHDSVDGVEPTRRAAGDTGLDVIAGAEFGVPVSDEGDEEIHLVGLFLDVESPALREGLKRNRAQRKQRVMEMIEKLNRIGVTLRTDEVLKLAAPGNVTRLHLARALVQAGRVRSVRTAFKRWLRPGNSGLRAARRACPPPRP